MRRARFGVVPLTVEIACRKSMSTDSPPETAGSESVTVTVTEPKPLLSFVTVGELVESVRA